MLENRVEQIRPLDQVSMEAARKHWSQVAKPLGSLGLLEDAVVRMAGIQGKECPDIQKKMLVVMCADNGVVAEGVTQTGQEVTGIVTANFTRGDTCACIMADCAGVDVLPVDIGVAFPLEDLGNRHPLLSKRIADGTRNLYREPAMDRVEALRAIEVGISLVEDLKKKGYGLILTGEMGIGNTTTSSAVVSVLLGQEPGTLTGRGAGLDDAGMKRKIHVIREAIRRSKPDYRDAVDVIAKVGGLDLAGLTGVFLGGAIYRIPVVVDGFISGAAALAASVISGEAVSYMIASHVSAEPAGALVLEKLGLKPVIHGGLCLGEGTGALTFVPLLDMALEVYKKMSTFDEIKVDQYQPL